MLIMFFTGVRIIPWLLERIAHTRSRELFILAILAITLGTAMGASELFGVSLALGAFVAGAIISKSHLSYQVGADVFAFREAFSVLFFVSVGMLVNPAFLLQNFGQVAALTTLVVVGKILIVILIGLLFPRPAHTFLVVAVGLSQVGEFSFILGQGGLSLQLLNSNQYSLILAAALFSITLNPFMYKLLPVFERVLRRVSFFWKQLESYKALPELKEEHLTNHVVIIGYGRVGKHMVDVLESLTIPFVVIETDAEVITMLDRRNIPTLYGEASNSEVIVHAHLDRARALVVTVPDETTSTMIVTAARDLNPNLPIIARADTEAGVHSLSKLGANHVVHPELEGGLELVHHTLLSLGYPLRQVHEYSESVRRDHYDIDITSDAEHRSLHELVRAFEGIEITWMVVDESSPIVGQSLAETNIRSYTGASVVALIRDKHLIANPKSVTVFESGDRIGMIGEDEQIHVARKLVDGYLDPSGFQV